MRTAITLARLGIAAAVVIACGPSCAQNLFYACEADSQCDLEGLAGTCLQGECAYPNPDCPSGLAYPDQARPQVAGQCVPQDTEPETASGPMLPETDTDSTGDGDTETDSDTEPTTGNPPVDPACAVEQLGGGEAHTCLRTTAGQVWCWGDNREAELGADVGEGTRTPTRVDALAAVTVTQIAVGGSHTCARTDRDALWCWGHQLNGEILGSGEPGSYPPTEVDVGPVSQVSAGGFTTCARLAGTVTCWGDSFWGQAGAEGGAGFNTVLSSVTEGMVALGSIHTCAATVRSNPPFDGVECWGDDEHGQLGDGGRIRGEVHSSMPVVVANLPGPVEHLALGDEHSCAVVDGQTWCWGQDSSDQLLGAGASSSAVLLAEVPTAQRLWSGREFSCVLDDGGALWCWGSNSRGQVDPQQPGFEAGLSQPATSIGAALGERVTFEVVGLGDNHGCGWAAATGLACWGDDAQGQLGDSITSTVGRPVLPGCR